MVSTELKGLKVSLGSCPAAIATIMVSPTARDIAKIIDTVMPEEAAGTITRKAVCRRVAPIPYEASRKDFGTARSASSLKEEMYGIIITPITNPAERALNPDNP